MANSSRGHDQHGRPSQAPSQIPGPVTPEPPVRRWPHPVDGTEPIQQNDPALHYIRCALSYQNQLLAEIKTLLQQMATEEKRGDGQEP